MELSAAEIERLVRDVMTRLEAETASRPAVSRPTAKCETGRLSVASGVVSLAELDGKLTDVTTLAVSPRAVVTPAVRDLLRQRKIALVRDDEGAKANTNGQVAAKPSVALAVAAKKFAAGRLVERLRRDGHAVQQLAQAGLAAAVREIADEAGKGGSRGLLVADEAEAALVALNRQRGVRAIGGDDAAAVARAAAAVAANVLVVRPDGKSDYAIERLVKAWLTAKPATNAEIGELLK